VPRVIHAPLGIVGVALVVALLLFGVFGGAMARSVSSPMGHASARGSASPGSSLGGAEPGAVPARTYETTVILESFTFLGATTAVPQAISIYVNVTWGSIDNTNTRAYVVVYDISAAKLFKVFSINNTIDTTNVGKFDNNGVLYQDYTWNFSLNKTTLGCADVSCADLIPVTNDYMYVYVYLTENGTSLGGSKTTASMYVPTYYGTETQLVSTFVTAGFTSPGLYTYNAVPVVVTFFTNISWGVTSNATTKMWVTLYNYITSTPIYNFSFNGTINTTNANGSSVSGFHGTVDGVPYSYTSYTLVLNSTTLGCSDVSCNKTLPAQTSFIQGLPVYAYVWSNENGSSAGGLPAFTGPVYSNYYDLFAIGSTMINTGTFGSPAPYQPLPYVQTGWLNVSWVNPAANQGNKTVGGSVYVYDTVTSNTIATLSLANAVNTTNSNGVSLKTASNGTTTLGTPYLNYTWSINFTATASSLGATVPYHFMFVYVNVTANGNGYGGVSQWTGNLTVFGTTFVQYPTTVSVSISPTLPAYVPTPYTQNFSIAVSNAPINPSTTTITVNIVDLTIKADGSDIVSSTAVAVGLGQTLYSFSVDPSTLTCTDPACLAYSAQGLTPSPTDLYGVVITAVVDGRSLPTNGSLASGTASASFYAIEVPLSARLVAPNPGVIIPPGNVTVTVVYEGSFVSAVALDIYSSTGALVFSVSFPSSGANATWVVTAPGTYTASVVVSTAYTPNTHYFNATLTISKTATNRVNTTSYSNGSIIPGLSPAAGGTLLLAIGLILGMIAAFLVGRAISGGRGAPTAPQPWQGKPGEGVPPGAGANTCNVCGKSFSTPEELAAHGKSEHGMQ
jgi:hypothetical protein